VAVAGGLYILNNDALTNYWVVVSLLPLAAYLLLAFLRARKLLHAEQGLQKEIVQSGFVALAAERSAQFWAVLFGLFATGACVGALLVWGYQAVIWFQKDAWTSITWLSVGGYVPNTEQEILQSFYTWLANTNLGVVFLVAGLLIAAPLAAIHSTTSQQAKQRNKELRYLKKR
jgi:hypothetical protein